MKIPQHHHDLGRGKGPSIVGWGWSLAWWDWWVVHGGVSWCFFYMDVFCVRGALPPLDVGAFSQVLMHFGNVFLALRLKKERRRSINVKCHMYLRVSSSFAICEGKTMNSQLANSF